MSLTLAFNRQHIRWQVRDADGNTDEPEQVTILCSCGNEIASTTTHAFSEKHVKDSPEMGLGHGSLIMGDAARFQYEVKRRNVPDASGEEMKSAKRKRS